eukprot:7290408-Alexandrium_andersonii.AAC.1
MVADGAVGRREPHAAQLLEAEPRGKAHGICAPSPWDRPQLLLGPAQEGADLRALAEQDGAR